MVSPAFGVMGGTTIEAPKVRALRRRVKWGMGRCPLPSRLRGLGERCELPEWGLGQSPGCPCISRKFQLKRWPLVVLKSGGVGVQVPLVLPKIMPMVALFLTHDQFSADMNQIWHVAS